jgi:two-component SAPR family response regulator
MGFGVVAFRDPRVALSLASDIVRKIDIAILDYKMPGMSGGEIAGRIKDINPSLKIIILTGWAEDAKGCNGLILQKPVGKSTLRKVVKKLLKKEG